jgi:glycosyltransferase involved in cell wall biosynthesis
MCVDFADSSDGDIFRPAGMLRDLRRRIRITGEQAPGVTARVSDSGLFSPALTSAVRAATIDASGADIVNVHWINMGFMSIAQLGRIRTPSVWTLHDMWVFTGGRHYTPEGPDARWRGAFLNGNAPKDDSRWDVDRWVWNRKRRRWTTPRQLVTPSRWLAGMAQESALMSDWPVAVIPNALNTDVFCPYPQAEARAFHHLPADVPLVLFALTTGLDDPRKGWDLLKDALRRLRLDRPDVELAVLGHDAPPGQWADDLPRAHWLGRLHDDRALAMAYSAADVTVVPSRQDNLPQTGTEAQACGCPVVGFRIGGLPDVLVDRETGFLADELEPASLATGLAWVLADDSRHEDLSARARERAVRLWSPSVVSAQYKALFEATLHPTSTA